MCNYDKLSPQQQECIRIALDHYEDQCEDNAVYAADRGEDPSEYLAEAMVARTTRLKVSR